MKAHIQGGVPKKEWNSKLLDTYDINEDLFFDEKNKEFYFFKGISERHQIRQLLENSVEFSKTDDRLMELLLQWFANYVKEIKKLRANKSVHELLDEGFATLQKVFDNNGVIDEYQTRGIFINWWDQNEFDLRTIKDTGWVQSLISNFDFESEDERTIEDTLEKIKYFFKKRFDEEISSIEKLEEREASLSTDIEQELQSEVNGGDDETESLDKILRREIKAIRDEINGINKLDPTQSEHVTK